MALCALLSIIEHHMAVASAGRVCVINPLNSPAFTHTLFFDIRVGISICYPITIIGWLTSRIQIGKPD